jgi:hypothetical protein
MTLSKTSVPLHASDDVCTTNDDDDIIEPKTSLVTEKSDADLDREELDRVRQRFNSKKVALNEKKKRTKLDVDDDDNDEQSNLSTKKT